MELKIFSGDIHFSGVTHYLLGGIATTWAFFLARIIAVG